LTHTVHVADGLDLVLLFSQASLAATPSIGRHCLLPTCLFTKWRHTAAAITNGDSILSQFQSGQRSIRTSWWARKV